MPITPERRAQIQQMLQQGSQPTAAQNTSTITPERRAQIDALVKGAQVTPQVQTPSQAAPTQPGAFQSFVQGIAKPFENVAATVAGIGEGAYNLARGDIKGANEALSRERDFGYFGKARPLNIDEQGNQATPGQNLRNVVGTAAELGSYIAPVGAGAATLGGRIGEGALFSGIGGALGSGGQALQDKNATAGSVLGSTLAGGAIGGALGGALPIAGAALRGGAKLAGNLGAEVLGRSTGAGEAAIKEAFNNPNVIRYARTAGKEGINDLTERALADASEGLSKIKGARSADYLSKLDQIKLNPTVMDEATQSVRSHAQDLLNGHGITFNEGKALNNLNFENSTITKNQKVVQKAFNDVMGWTDNTPAGLDKLKKRLGQHIDEIPVTERGGARAFVTDLKSTVDRQLDDVPGYREMTKGYREASDLIDEIKGALSLRDTAAKDTAIRKLMSTMRQNNELRLELLKSLGSASGKDITGKIAGATLAPKTPRGLAGVLQPSITGAGIGSAFFNPASIPALLLYLGASSPRLVAEAVSILGRFKGTAIPAIAQQQLRNLLIKAINNPSDGSSDQNSPQYPVQSTTEAPAQ